MTEHVGYEKHDPEGPRNGNSRNGTRSETVSTAIGPVDSSLRVDHSRGSPISNPVNPVSTTREPHSLGTVAVPSRFSTAH